jgi:hypothetical protein
MFYSISWQIENAKVQKPVAAAIELIAAHCDPYSA